MSYSIQIGDQPFDYTDPYGHKPSLPDAVHAISNICRFGGHTREFYSVAQHSVFVSVLCENLGGNGWDGLAHDLAEAYYGDFPSPLKAMIRATCPMLSARMNTIDTLVEDTFLFDGHNSFVKKADLIALVTEKRDLLADSKQCIDIWKDFASISPSSYTIIPLSPADSEKAWWKRYHQLLAKKQAPLFKNVPVSPLSQGTKP